MVTRILLYLMGGLAGAMLGAGVAMHLIKSMGLSNGLAGAFTGCTIAVFLGVAHMLARTLVEEEKELTGATPGLASSSREAALRHPPCSAWLIPTGQGNRVSYPLTKPCTLIGRDVENDVMINSASMSRSHAQIVQMEGSWLVLDLDSKNGTFVNGEKVVQKQLRDGDELVLGSVHFRLRIEEVGGVRRDRERDDPRDSGERRDPTLPPGAETYQYRAQDDWARESGGGRRRDDWASNSGGGRRDSYWPGEERRQPRSPYDAPYEGEDRRRPDRRGYGDRRQGDPDGYPDDRRQSDRRDVRGYDRRPEFPDDRRRRDSEWDRRSGYDDPYPEDQDRRRRPPPPRDYYPPPPDDDPPPPPPPRW